MERTGLMLSDEEKLNALDAIAKRCNSDMKGADKNNIALLQSITSIPAKTAIALGFSRTDLLVRIGVINGRLMDRANE